MNISFLLFNTSATIRVFLPSFVLKTLFELHHLNFKNRFLFIIIHLKTKRLFSYKNKQILFYCSIHHVLNLNLNEIRLGF